MSDAATHEPAPKPGRQAVITQVITDIFDRAAMGQEKYGTLLMTHNGRDPLWDAYQEAIDLVMYLRQAIMEREEARETLPFSEPPSCNEEEC